MERGKAGAPRDPEIPVIRSWAAYSLHPAAMLTEKLDRRPQLRILRNPRIAVGVEQARILGRQPIGDDEAEIIVQRNGVLVESPMYAAAEQQSVGDHVDPAILHRHYMTAFCLDLPELPALPATGEAATMLVFRTRPLPEAYTSAPAFDVLSAPLKRHIRRLPFFSEAVIGCGNGSRAGVVQDCLSLDVGYSAHCPLNHRSPVSSNKSALIDTSGSKSGNRSFKTGKFGDRSRQVPVANGRAYATHPSHSIIFAAAACGSCGIKDHQIVDRLGDKWIISPLKKKHGFIGQKLATNISIIVDDAPHAGQYAGCCCTILPISNGISIHNKTLSCRS